MEEVGNINGTSNFDELQSSFEEYMEELKKQPLRDKKRELVDSIKEVIASIDLLAHQDGIELHYLTSKEIMDKSEEDMVDDDFVESMIVYVETAKNMIGEYLGSEK